MPCIRLSNTSNICQRNTPTGWKGTAYESVTPGGTDDMLFYKLTSVEFLIGSVTVQHIG